MLDTIILLELIGMKEYIIFITLKHMDFNITDLKEFKAITIKSFSSKALLMSPGNNFV